MLGLPQAVAVPVAVEPPKPPPPAENRKSRAKRRFGIFTSLLCLPFTKCKGIALFEAVNFM